MPRVPANTSDLITFCNDKAASWTGLTGIGILPADVTKLKADLSAAQTAVAAQVASKSAAKNATLNAKVAVSTLRKTINTLVRTIVSYAESQPKPDTVFALASLEPDAPRTPSAPPGQPTNITAVLSDQGDVTLRWKCVNPTGGNVVYIISRREGSTGAYAQVGTSGGKREFVDEDIPAGSARVEYVIRGLRGGTTGPASPTFSLYFGHDGDGRMTMKTEKPPFRVAA